MMDNCTKFSDLTAHLRELFKSASYSESTVKDMDFILQAFSDCMDAKRLGRLLTGDGRNPDPLLRRNSESLYFQSYTGENNRI